LPCHGIQTYDPCGHFSPVVGCGAASPVINQPDPLGQVVNPAVDLATLKAELRSALARVEEQEKTQAQALAPKTPEDTEEALRALDEAQRELDAARNELRSKGGSKK